MPNPLINTQIALLGCVVLFLAGIYLIFTVPSVPGFSPRWNDKDFATVGVIVITLLVSALVLGVINVTN